MADEMRNVDVMEMGEKSLKVERVGGIIMWRQENSETNPFNM